MLCFEVVSILLIGDITMTGIRKHWWCTIGSLLLLLEAHLICCVHGIVNVNGHAGSGESMRTQNELIKSRRPNVRLLILPPLQENSSILYKKMDDTLNLTCVVKFDDVDNHSLSTEPAFPEPEYKLSWILPQSPSDSQHRVQVSSGPEKNSLMLSISNLQESDNGLYVCEARLFLQTSDTNTLPERSVDVNIKPKKTLCTGDNSFHCLTGECIHQRQHCDGRPDCKDGSDEDPSICGTNPCDGKLRCEDRRCISKSWCCDKYVDPNCTLTVLSCCKQLFPSYNLNGQYIQHHLQQTHHFNDKDFLTTTIYTVIVTIMIIAICKLHLKRSLPRYPVHWNQTTQFPDERNGESWGNLLLNSGGSASSGLLVTYNINNGVQFVGRPANPPPYSEIIRAPPAEGPPPPYQSAENIASVCSSSASTNNTNSTQATHLRRTIYLVANDQESSLEPLLNNNNNGDINGNSEPNSHNVTTDNSNITNSVPPEPEEESSAFVPDCQI